MSGESVYAVCVSPSGSTMRHRNQPPERSSSTDSVCVGGTCTITSPGSLNPPVRSSTSQRTQPSAASASHTHGGSVGSMPWPSASHSTRMATAQLGTARLSPM